MKPKIAAPQGEQNPLGITDYSVLMQVRSRALNDLQDRIPADYYSSRAVATKLAIYEPENLDRIRHLARLDFNLAKELAEENDKNPVSTPREVSATEVVGLVGYCLMFLALDESQRTPNRLVRMRGAEVKLREALSLYVLHLDDVEARPIRVSLAATDPSTDVEAASMSTNGTVTVWTQQRKDAARAMLKTEKGRGVKAYAANTAAKFGVSTARLRQVLRDATTTKSTRKPASTSTRKL
ncbi:MAG: hypothetical protein NTX31_07525 [Burkholderiales bacterium]|nr:hypothetical protein [Burkholderiales bacterium]